jgi:hypothetical protein
VVIVPAIGGAMTIGTMPAPRFTGSQNHKVRKHRSEDIKQRFQDLL